MISDNCNQNSGYLENREMTGQKIGALLGVYTHGGANDVGFLQNVLVGRMSSLSSRKPQLKIRSPWTSTSKSRIADYKILFGCQAP